MYQLPVSSPVSFFIAIFINWTVYKFTTTLSDSFCVSLISLSVRLAIHVSICPSVRH